MPLPDLDILVAILDKGNLSAASDWMGIPRPTLTRRLRRLEEDVGVELVHLNTRRVVPTEAGLRLCSHARLIVSAIEEARNEIRSSEGELRGRLRVGVPNCNQDIHSSLCAFTSAYPGINLEVTVSPEQADLMENRIDISIRSGS